MSARKLTEALSNVLLSGKLNISLIFLFYNCSLLQGITISDQKYDFFQHIYRYNYGLNDLKVGVLSVYQSFQKQDSSIVQTPAIWEMKSAHGDHWNLATITYDGGNQSIVNYIIEGYANDKQTGDLALDDISLKYGPCTSPSYVGVTCDFEEEHLCGYLSDPTVEFNWNRKNGPSAISGDTGPMVDVSHSIISISHILIEFNN